MYCIEGNIGSGKSTLIKCLSEKYTCFREPVEEWHLLGDFYKNMKLFSGPFQYQVLLSQYKQLKEVEKLSENQICFVERCPWTSRNVFLELMIKENILNENYLNFYDEFYNNINQNIKKMFFLVLNPVTCSERIKQRNRYEEENINLEYLELLEEQYSKSLTKADFEVEYIFVKDKSPYDIANEIIKKIHT